MKITKQQRAVRDKAVNQAAVTAIGTHFAGPGAQARIMRFTGDSLYSSCSWFVKLLCLGSWSIVAGLLIGPEHDLLLSQFQAWMIETPVDQVSSYLQSGFMSVVEVFVKLSLFLGFGQKVLAVIKPATEDAKRSFRESLAQG